MYGGQIVGKPTLHEVLNQANLVAEPFIKAESPPKKFSFLNTKIEEVLRKHTAQDSSQKSSPGSENTARHLISEIPETRLKGPQDFGISSLDHSLARYSKPTDRPPSYKPDSHFSGNLTQRNYLTPSSINYSDRKLNFSASSYANRSPDPRNDPSVLNKSSFFEKTSVAPDLNDIDAKVKAALLKSKANLEKVKSSGVFPAFDNPYSAQKDSLRSSFHSSRSFHERPIGPQSAEKLSSALKTHALSVTPFEKDSVTTARAINEYHNLSNEELASLVADIKKEFQPKLKEFEAQQLKAEPLLSPSANSSTYRKFELNIPVSYKDTSPLKKRDRAVDVSLEDRSSAISNAESVDLQINQLKKDLQSYFKPEE